MPPEPRQPDPELQVTFEPPDEEQPRVPFSMTDVLDHLAANAREQRAAPRREEREEQGLRADQVDELARRLDNVARLSAELRAELAALEALRPPGEQGGGPPILR